MIPRRICLNLVLDLVRILFWSICIMRTPETLMQKRVHLDPASIGGGQQLTLLSIEDSRWNIWLQDKELHISELVYSIILMDHQEQLWTIFPLSLRETVEK
ncbi:hypothetical protein CMV_021669 [Castanea mollissima]|uniref:Uncharacterized protein n=1 Tax=Castanea mollissima TaxID=60419 RepID=A0A8J4VKE0_9ROSI|nr:hypothetical protein CMV_021669 [Castanea mollissima]